MHDGWTHSIADHPDYAEKLGIITAEWSGFEFALCLLFQCMLGVDGNRAEAIFFSLTNNRSRREIIASLSKALISDNVDLRNKIDRILRRSRSAASRRNALAHGIWHFGEGADSGGTISLDRDTGILKASQIEAKALDQTISQLRILRKDIHMLAIEVKNTLYPS